MKMTEEAIKRFNDTVRGFSEKYSIPAICDHVRSENHTVITFEHPRIAHHYKRHCFHWDEMSSITAGLAVAFADVLYWIQDGRVDYNRICQEQAYISADMINTGTVSMQQNAYLPKIKKVHFSGPVTCVIWADGTKTLVRCNAELDYFDPEKGLAMAIAKKALGTNASGSNYYDIFKEWLPEVEEVEVPELTPMSDEFVNAALRALRKIMGPCV